MTLHFVFTLRIDRIGSICVNLGSFGIDQADLVGIFRKRTVGFRLTLEKTGFLPIALGLDPIKDRPPSIDDYCDRRVSIGGLACLMLDNPLHERIIHP